jgi:hypothetical protein
MMMIAAPDVNPLNTYMPSAVLQSAALTQRGRR